MTSKDKDAKLYGTRKSRNLNSGKEISSSTTLSFASQLGSLISSSSSTSAKPTASRSRPKKEDIFATHNRNTAKRAKRDLDDSSPAFAQKHTTNGESLDSSTWERSKRKMEGKARLYAAMKRGDVEDLDEKYAVDFDRKWAETNEDAEVEDEDLDSEDGADETVDYTDEFGRERTGTIAEKKRAERIMAGEKDIRSDRFTARPSAPTNVIYGDTIQHAAFNPDEMTTTQMEALAAKRDKSLTPPPDEHFDATKEVRTKGTGFFQFSGDAEERKKQMDNLERERMETEDRRKERSNVLDARKRKIEERKAEIAKMRGKRKADGFLEQLGEEMVSAQQQTGERSEMLEKIESAVEKEEED